MSGGTKVQLPGRLRTIDFGMSPACPVRLNIGTADCPVLPVEGIGLDLIHAAAHIRVAFCCDPEAEADLRCGLAAVFLAGASLDFLPSIASLSFCPLAALRRHSYSFTAVEHRFQVSDDADRLFVANAQKNCSRRRHGFLAPGSIRPRVSLQPRHRGKNA